MTAPFRDVGGTGRTGDIGYAADVEDVAFGDVGSLPLIALMRK
ncbi:hypothetical protein [Streptomyces sp. NBC_00083]|nr:hypothetical protein [Streptomyces sp. NBC_00083]MCX5386367.1 hypothetical protein [Streptomyces sp. NBC_00083]